MSLKTTSERNVQMLIFLMKFHKIRFVVASPGTTNLTFVASIQSDPFFTVFSSVDERSAAYIACGLSVESGEPVALSCTGATASRNYLSGLTEAYYRKIPILAITASQHFARVGENVAQVIDRTTQPRDIAKISLQLPSIQSDLDEKYYAVKINEALLELRRGGGGPVHINIVTEYSRDFSVGCIPPVKTIRRFYKEDSLPAIPNGKVAIFVGNHRIWNEHLTNEVDFFCEKYDSVVLCDRTSNYFGKYRILPSFICNQEQWTPSVINVDLLIHIGDVSGASYLLNAKEVWRVNIDGEVRDTFGLLTNVFEMAENEFFEEYNSFSTPDRIKARFYSDWKRVYFELYSLIPELPFSNCWIAKKIIGKFPDNSVLHLGILNSLRTWSFFECEKNIPCFANTGGFGIDGCLSSLLGASFGDEKKLYFGVIGDLSFFYDMNCLGNRHVGNNLRIMVINNGVGTEFKNYNHPAAQFGEAANSYIAAAGHFGKKSRSLVKHYAEDLGFLYLSADSKNQFNEVVDLFFDTRNVEKPILFEVFVNDKDESMAIKMMYNLKSSTKGVIKSQVKSIMGNKSINFAKKLLGKG